MNMLQNLKTYFKRVKQPIAKLQDAKAIVSETKLYMAICFGVGVVCSILSGMIDALYWPLAIIGIVGIMAGLYFALMLYAMSRVLSRMDNLTCKNCGSSLNNSEYATWKEISRRWADSQDKNSAYARLYVTVQFTCKCPNCGEVKVFKEVLCSGKITVTNHSVRDTIVSTQTLVDDYFNGLIHA